MGHVSLIRFVEAGDMAAAGAADEAQERGSTPAGRLCRTGTWLRSAQASSQEVPTSSQGRRLACSILPTTALANTKQEGRGAAESPPPPSEARRGLT